MQQMGDVAYLLFTDSSLQKIYSAGKRKGMILMPQEQATGDELSLYPLLAYALYITTERELARGLEEGDEVKGSLVSVGVERGDHVAGSSYSGEIQAKDRGEQRTEIDKALIQEFSGGKIVPGAGLHMDVTDSESMINRVMARYPEVGKEIELFRALIRIRSSMKRGRLLVHVSDSNMLVDVLTKNATESKLRRFRELMEGKWDWKGEGVGDKRGDGQFSMKENVLKSIKSRVNREIVGEGFGIVRAHKKEYL